ncbi:MAG: aminopeptidase N, partial [Micromonosporaceae bacterium]
MRNLIRAEAIERARLIDVATYDVTLDLSNAPTSDRTFRSRSEIQFSCSEPGADTFIEIAADRVRSATLNGVALDTSGFDPEAGLALPGLAAENILVIDADCHYSRKGQGLHRASDPVDGATYLYTQFESTDAQLAYACFDQPDLKATFTFHVKAPADWHVISNMPVAEEVVEAEAKTVHFAQSPKMSTYITAICAGPYHVARDHHDGVDLGLYCRASMAEHLEAEDVFTITKQGFDFFQSQFDFRYPLPKYDQLFVPEYNAGAMENFGCVTISEDIYLFRSQVTDHEYEQRANTVLHELAHMWFGDLVTMRWWDDLWLNESFADWASHWCSAEATRFGNAWSTFLAQRKAWGYRQDQLVSTHPVHCDIPDVAAVEVNFDGITYAKGASVLKQLVAYVGIEPFVTGLRAYFQAHQYGNATFDDLLTSLEKSSGRELRKFAAEWLETSQVNTLRPVIELDADGSYHSVAISQTAPAAYPTLRTHRLAVGLYDLKGNDLVRRDQIELDVSGERTEITQLAGVPAADVLLLNDDDLTYAKIRLDERSSAVVMKHIDRFSSSLARSLCWSAAWDMARDGELSTRGYLRQVVSGLPAERDVNLIAVTARQAMTALAMYADPSWAPQGWRDLARGAAEALAKAEPGSGVQLAWARVHASAARDQADLAALRGWLEGSNAPKGLRIDTGMRWHVLESLVAQGAAGETEIEAELRRDSTASGQVAATRARALIPTPEAKAEAWRRLIEDPDLTNAHGRAICQGFQHSSQVELTRPYVERYFSQVADVWKHQSSDPAQIFAILMYPAYQVSDETVTATDAWLADTSHPSSLRRLVAEGKDGV